MFDNYEYTDEYIKIKEWLSSIPLKDNIFKIERRYASIIISPYLDNWVKNEYSTIEIKITKNTIIMLCKKTYTDIAVHSKKSERKINGIMYNIVRDYSLNYYVSKENFAVVVNKRIADQYPNKAPRMLNFFKGRKLSL